MSVNEEIPTKELMEAIAAVATPEKCLKAASHLNMWNKADEYQSHCTTWTVMRKVLEEYKNEKGESNARKAFIKACVTADLYGALEDKVKTMGFSMPRSN